MNKLLGICLFSLASAWVMAQENNAEQAFLRGDFAQAITYWQAAEAEPEIHLRMVDAYQHLGHYQAGQALLENLEPTISERSLTVQAEFWYAWSRLYMAQGEDYHEQADAVLIQAFAAAQQVDSGNLTARLLNHQATLQQLAFLFTDAEHTYQQALRILTAKNTPADTLVRAKIHLNRWRNAQAQRVSVNTLWQQAQQAWLSLPPSHAQVMALLQLAEADSITDTASRDNLFQTAWDSAAKLKNSALQAYVTGLWGGFQQNQGHSDAALKLTRQAVFFAQQQPHSARLYRWYHQLARLLHQRGAETAALTAYRKAVKHLRSRWHQEAYQGYRILPSRFPEQIVPLYMGFVELLLQQAEKEQGEKQQQLLHEAVAVVEQFKRLELEDYLQTPCKTSDARACPLLKIAAPEGTAILYPLIFEKYLVLLLKIGDKLHVIKQATGAEVLRQEVAVLGSLLRSAQHQMPLRKTTATQYATFNCAALSRSPELSVANPFQNIGAVIKQSQRLHQWLIKPLQGTLSQNDIRHLLIVPDGILRTLPFSALHDGNSYLIQRY
ncbi:CHAT domain-containing protein, partial [Candidatus Venteria ishoeyi]|uniref:CHAT domain-containing protein n=1 Tax=Candidatus Venteria ishoeyi TaxID=1899563 RepID=UPI000A7DD514